MNSQDDYIIRGIQAVRKEQYEVVDTKSGEYAIKIAGASAGEGYVCKFPKREGREYMQKARAERLVSSAASVKKLRSALVALVGADGKTELMDMEATLDFIGYGAPPEEVSSARTAIQVLLETLGI